MSENGMIQKIDLYQIWEQEEFRQILPFKEYIFDMLIHLDIVSEQRRYDTKTGSRLPIENFFVPCMLTQRNDTDFLTQECTPERTLSLAFVFKGTIIPPALPNRLICACLSMWTLKQYRGRKLMFSGFVGLSVDKEHDIVVCVEGNKILLYLIHKRSKGLIVPEIATSVRECLHLTLERISEFYQSTVHEKVRSQLPFHTEYSCSRFICYFPEERLALKTDECVCKHGDDITLNWKVWNQEQKQKQCDPDCTGIPDDILDCIPSDEILDRLAPLIGKMFFQLGIELGLSVEDIESIKEKCDRDLTAQNKEVLFTWRKDRTVKPTIRVLEQAFVNIGKGARCLKEVVKDVDPNTLKAVEMVTDRIRENENRIVQDIQICQILDHMMTHLVISADDRRDIEHYPRQDDQNKALLDIVIKRREPAYSVFVDGLRNYGYEDIADNLQCAAHGISHSPTLVSAENEGLSVWNFPLYKVRLQKNYLKVITDIQHESIVDHLISREVLSVDDGKKIESGKNPQEKNRNLMDMLLRKNEQGFNEFLKALRKDSIYADLADQIEKTEVTSTDMATLHKCLK
ncbi:unnamed protein product [Mytilus edulis]|uniref:Death domain-containing protein n=1 Tax=Mytilus edulis TaxID=6550 RepID=A0A8S3RW36_MYTED|nr:unnamed protein product [Mytilus edulis]